MVTEFSKNNFQAPSQQKALDKTSENISKTYAPKSSDGNKLLNAELALTRNELLEVSQNICLYYAPEFTANTQKLVIVPVDREHIYACWNLGSDKDHLLAKSMMDKQLILSIYPQQRAGQEKPHPFTEITVSNLQGQQKIRLPVSKAPIQYSASIAEKGSTPLLESTTIKPFHIAEGASSEDDLTSLKGRINSRRGSLVINKNSLEIRPISIKPHYANSHKSAKGLN